MLQKLSYSWRCPGPRQRSQVLLMKNRDNLTRLKRNKNWMHVTLWNRPIIKNILRFLNIYIYVLRVRKNAKATKIHAAWKKSKTKFFSSLKPALYCSLLGPYLTSGWSLLILYSYWSNQYDRNRKYLFKLVVPVRYMCGTSPFCHF